MARANPATYIDFLLASLIGMRSAPRWLCDASHAALLLSSVVSLACGLPTDESGEVFVTVEASTTVLVRGQSLVLEGAVWQQRTARSPVRMAGASLTWKVDPASAASLTRREDGSVLLTGINTGTVRVQATALDYEDAEPGTLDVRVSNTIEIDSLRPARVRYGDQVTVYGVGLGHIARVSLGETSLIPDPTSFSGDPNAAGSQRFWVPYPAASGRLLATATEGFSAPSADAIEVIPRTVYFTGDGSPALISLDNTLDSGAVLFDNPALALTPEGGGNLLRLLLADSTRPVTISVSTTAPVITSMVPSIAPDVASVSEAYWSVGTATAACGSGIVSVAPELDFGPLPATIVRSFERTPADGLVLRVDGSSPGRFAVRIVEGFAAADPRIAPDRFEENDSCVAADSVSRVPSTAIDLLAGFAEELTIDQGYDLDWFRFTVPADPARPFDAVLVTARTVSLPFGAADSSNLDLGLLDSNDKFGEPHEVEWLAESRTPGSSERASAELFPGDYYLVVSDEAGVPTRYGLCLAIGNDCDPAAAAASVR